MTYDVIIVGARCGGAPTAMLLARRGYRTLLVDRSTFPSDIMSTHLIKPSGVLRLGRWGLLPRVVATGCPPISRITVNVGDFPLTATLPAIRGLDAMYAPRRIVLDRILVDAAVEAGVELREAVSVSRIAREGDRVVGIEGRTRHGAMVRERARIVVGADGMRSLVAKEVQARTYDGAPTRACWYYSYWSGVGLDEFRVHSRPGRYVLAFPTNEGLTCMLLGWPREDFHAVRADVEAAVGAVLSEVDVDLAGRVRAGRREERYVGTADVPGYFRKPFGAGWALVGDAGYHLDPCSGWGIANAFRDAELLADGVHAGFTGLRPLDDALADYETARNRDARPYYERTCQVATLRGASEGLLRLRAALRHQPGETSRFMGAVQGTLSVEEYFAPANIRRVLDAAPPG
jgi:flavin-dependent dehydrogenase